MSIPSANERSLSAALHPAILAHQATVRGIHGDPEHFGPLHAGPCILSIQGSDRNYCEPRINLSTLGSYDEVEIGIFDRDADWFDVYEVYPELEALLDELGTNQGPRTIIPYLSWPDVNRLYLALLAEVGA